MKTTTLKTQIKKLGPRTGQTHASETVHPSAGDSGKKADPRTLDRVKGFCLFLSYKV